MLTDGEMPQHILRDDVSSFIAVLAAVQISCKNKCKQMVKCLSTSSEMMRRRLWLSLLSLRSPAKENVNLTDGGMPQNILRCCRMLLFLLPFGSPKKEMAKSRATSSEMMRRRFLLLVLPFRSPENVIT
jgi:hypothetical protein